MKTHVVCQPRDNLEVVLDETDRLAGAAKPLDREQHRFEARPVDPRRGLVNEQNVAAGSQHAGNREQLLLAEAEAVRSLGGAPVKSDEGEVLERALGLRRAHLAVRGAGEGRATPGARPAGRERRA